MNRVNPPTRHGDYTVDTVAVCPRCLTKGNVIITRYSSTLEDGQLVGTHHLRQTDETAVVEEIIEKRIVGELTQYQCGECDMMSEDLYTFIPGTEAYEGIAP